MVNKHVEGVWGAKAWGRLSTPAMARRPRSIRDVEFDILHFG
jgi:hypothetical protein